MEGSVSVDYSLHLWACSSGGGTFSPSIHSLAIPSYASGDTIFADTTFSVLHVVTFVTLQYPADSVSFIHSAPPTVIELARLFWFSSLVGRPSQPHRAIRFRFCLLWRAAFWIICPANHDICQPLWVSWLHYIHDRLFRWTSTAWLVQHSHLSGPCVMTPDSV